VDEVLAGLQSGRQAHVRTVGSDAQLQDVYDTLSHGGVPVEVPRYKGSWVQRPDGVRIGLRESSTSGGRTIDINEPNNETPWKVHIR
jgi:hypothetical protein